MRCAQRVGMATAAGITDGRDVINVNAEALVGGQMGHDGIAVGDALSTL
jgi:hypothetical protein